MTRDQTATVVPCGVHPLHRVKIFASGARGGCPMCEMQVEDLCRSIEHAPRLTQDQARIVGCACG